MTNYYISDVFKNTCILPNMFDEIDCSYCSTNDFILQDKLIAKKIFESINSNDKHDISNLTCQGCVMICVFGNDAKYAQQVTDAEVVFLHFETMINEQVVCDILHEISTFSSTNFARYDTHMYYVQTIKQMSMIKYLMHNRHLEENERKSSALIDLVCGDSMARKIMQQKHDLETLESELCTMQTEINYWKTKYTVLLWDSFVETPYKCLLSPKR